jgi:hypothetical protein
MGTAPPLPLFWGFRLYLITTAEGMPIVWGLASPTIGER